MKSFFTIAIAGFLCLGLLYVPVHAAETGVAGIEFYEPAGGGSGGGSSGGSSSSRPGGGTGSRDRDPPRLPAPAPDPDPAEELVWMVSPSTPLKQLGPLPATGSSRALATLLVLAGIGLMALSARNRRPHVKEITMALSHGCPNTISHMRKENPPL